MLSIYHACDRAITIRMIEESPTLQPRRRPDRPARSLVFGTYRCSVSSFWVGGLPWYLPALVLVLPVMCRPSGCARWGGGHRRGIQGAQGVGQVMPAIKFFKEKGVFSVPLANTHPTFTNQNPSDCASLQKFPKIQKDPFRSLDCGIIS